MKRRGTAVMAALSLGCAGFAVAAFPAGTATAATFSVTNGNDSGAGSLRAALAAADAAPGADTVSIQAGLTINATSPLTWSDGPVTITGNGSTLDMGGATSGLVDGGGDGLTLSGLTITGVGGSTSGEAAPVIEEGGALDVSDCEISGNNAQSDDGDVAGGLLNEGGSIRVENCIITDNIAGTVEGDAAGGISSEGGPVTVLDSTIDGNTGSTDDGDSAGGVLSEGGDVNVGTSEISNNTADAVSGSSGGGIMSFGQPVVVRDSQVNCNTATADDGGFELVVGGIGSAGDDLTVSQSDVLGNKATATAGGTAENSLTADGGTENVTDSNVDDDPSACNAPPPTTTTAPGTTTTTVVGSTTTTTTPPGEAPGATPVSGGASFTG